MPYKQLKGIDNDSLLQIALQQNKVKELLGDKTFEVRNISCFDEYGGRVFLHVTGLKLAGFKDKNASAKKSKDKKNKVKVSA